MTTDVERFERGDESAYGGELLPDERCEQWTLGPRAPLRERRLAVMRSKGLWEENDVVGVGSGHVACGTSGQSTHPAGSGRQRGAVTESSLIRVSVQRPSWSGDWQPRSEDGPSARLTVDGQCAVDCSDAVAEALKP